MGDAERSIETAIQKLAGLYKKDRISVFIGEVESISEQGSTCTAITDNGTRLTNIRLQASIDDGIVITPAIKSDILILYSAQNGAYAVMYSKVDKVYIESQSVNINGQISLNGDSKGGLVMAPELVQQLNGIKDDINLLKSVFLTWTPVATDGGAALKAAASSWAGQNLPATQQSEIENEKIKHGN